MDDSLSYQAQPSVKLPYKVTQYFDHDIWNFRARRDLLITSLDEIHDYLDKRISTHFFKPMENLRDFMHAGYLTREVFGHLELPESYTNIQVQFAVVLRGLRDGPGEWRDVGVMKRKTSSETSKKQDAPNPRASPGPSHNRKRERDSDEFEDKNDGADNDDKGEASPDHPSMIQKRCRHV